MKDTARPFLIIISLLLALIIAVWGLGETLFPLVFSFALAYLLFPLIRKLEEKGIKRIFSLTSISVLFFVMIIVFLALIVPGLIQDGQIFLKELPANSIKAAHKIEVLLETLGYPISMSQDSIGIYFKAHATELSQGLLKVTSQSLKSSFFGLSKWLIAILNLFLIPLFFFYVISDYEKIVTEIKSFIPKPMRPKLKHYMDLTNTVLSGHIRGQLLVVATLSILYAIGLSLVGLKFGFLIGILSGLISIIPYAGFSIGFLMAIIMALANYSGMGQIVGIIFVYMLIQALEGIVITPKLVGDKVGLSAFATMLALIIGGNILGILGMLIAIPVAAILKSIINELKHEYQQLDFYNK